MAYNKKTAVVTKEDAEEVVRYGFAYDDNLYGFAVDFLQTNYPESAVLPGLVQNDGKVDFAASQYVAAQNYALRAQASGNAANPDLQAAAEQFKQEYEAQTDAQEDAGVEQNYNSEVSADDSFDNLFASLQSWEQGEDPQWRHVVRSVNEQIDFRVGAYYSDETTKELQQTLWETVKTKILVNRTLNPEWQAVMQKSAAEKNAWLHEEIKRVYTAEAVIQAGASKVKKPNKEEQKLGSQAHADYIARVAQETQRTFDGFVHKNRKLNISSDQVVYGASNAWSKLKSFIKYSEIKQLGQSFVAKLENYRDSFDSRMQQRHPNMWGIAKSAAESFRAAKWQTITDVAVTTVTMGIGATTGAFAAAMVGYAAYMTVSGFVWPVANKKALELNRAKKKGDEAAAKWKGSAGWNRAVAAIFDNPRERKSYWWRVGGRAVASGLAAGITAVSGPVETVAGLAALRFKQAFMRVLGTVSGQAGLVVGDTIAYAKDKTAENKGYLKQSATGLAVSTVFSGAALWLAHHFVTEPAVEHQAQQNLAESLVVDSAAQKDLPDGATLLAETKNGARAYELGDRVIFEENGKVAHNILAKDYGVEGASDAQKQEWASQVLARDEAKQTEAARLAAEAKETAAAATPEVAENNALIHFFGKDEDGNAFVPTEYSKDYGVTLAEFKTIKNSVGILAKQAVSDALNHEKPDPDALYDAAVRNLAVYLKEHPDVAPGKNPLQVMRDVFTYHRGALGHWDETVKVEGEGTFGVSRQVDGRWVYPYSAYSKEMNAWFDIMCNGNPKESVNGLNLNAPMEHLSEVLDENNRNRVVFDCDVALLIKGKKPVVEQPVEVPSSTEETVHEDIPVEVSSFTEGTVHEDIPVQESALYVKTTRNITNGHYGATPGHEKVVGVTKIVADKGREG